MSLTKDQILQEGMKLNARDLEQLADAFWRIAHGETCEQIENEWRIEIRRRLDSIARGEGTSKLSDDVVERLRKKRAS